MKTVFADPTPRWVPFVAAAMIVIGVWIAGVWDGFDFPFVTRFAVGLACVLFVLIFFQGRYYWKDQVQEVRGDGEYFEALTSVWVGRGKRISFAPHEASGWVARPRSEKPEDLSTIAFKAKGTPLELSFVNPKRVDVAALSQLAPEFFGEVRRDYPSFKDVVEP
jgi:hypothetical protein